MLTLHYNGSEIPTGREFSLLMKWVNPVCYMDSIPGNAGLGIEIPVNEYSRSAFGHPDRFEKQDSAGDRKFPGFTVRYAGVLLMEGTLIITSANAQTYSGWLQSDLGTLGDTQRDKFLPDMEWKRGVVFENKPSYDPDQDDYYPFPILNGAFWNGKGRETAISVEYTDEDGEVHKSGDMIGYLTWVFRRDFTRIVNSLDGSGVKSQGEACVVSPYLYLRYVIREMLRLSQFFIDRNDMIPFVDINLTRGLLVYNNYNIMTVTLGAEYFEYTHYDREKDEFIHTIERRITQRDWHLNPFSYKNLLPQVPLKDFILGLQNYLNYVFVFKALGKVDIVDRNEVATGEAFDLDPWFQGEWVMGEQKDVSLKFLSEFDREDRMFGQEYHDLSDRKADFGDPVQLFSDLEALPHPQIGELRLVRGENRIYEYKWKVLTSEDIMYRETQFDALGWEFVSTGPQPFVYGESEEVEEIKTTFSTLQRTSSGGGLPVVLQQGNFDQMKQLWTQFTPRLINANELLFPDALSWEGEAGLFNARWKKWGQLWSTRLPVEGSFALPLHILCYVSGNLTQKYRTRHGEFIIQEMETEFSSNMVGPSRIKGYKV